MKKRKNQSGCHSCSISRRGFLSAGCAACAGAAGLLARPTTASAAQDKGKMRIRVIYSLHAPVQPGPDWPNVGFDFKPVMKEINEDLARKCPDFEFIPTMANGPDQAKKILEEDKSKSIDGYIVLQMNCWNRVVQTMVTSGKPVLYVDFQFAGSGGFLVYTAAFLRQKTQNFAFVGSSRRGDLIEAVKCFKIVKNGGSVSDFVTAVTNLRKAGTPKPGSLICNPDPLKTASIKDCIAGMKASRILAVRDTKSGPAQPIVGIPMEFVSFAEVNEAWKAADKDQSRSIADRWQKDALSVVDVSRETLETSAAMYLGMKEVLKKHNANAITINCLGGFYGNHIHAYPCLGFHELNNEGLVGGCECDVQSTASMVLWNKLTQGRPGFISDPVIDTAKRQIIYAHCVAPKKMFGPQGRTNPFEIMTHSEDRQGAAVRSILPLGYMVTSIKVNPQRKEIIFHQGRAVDNDPDDRACRTKLGVEPVGDIEKLFTMWDQWGWHRVTCYGDLKEPIHALAQEINWQVVEEA